LQLIVFKNIFFMKIPPHNHCTTKGKIEMIT